MGRDWKHCIEERYFKGTYESTTLLEDIKVPYLGKRFKIQEDHRSYTMVRTWNIENDL